MISTSHDDAIKGSGCIQKVKGMHYFLEQIADKDDVQIISYIAQNKVDVHQMAKDSSNITTVLERVDRMFPHSSQSVLSPAAAVGKLTMDKVI